MIRAVARPAHRGLAASLFGSHIEGRHYKLMPPAEKQKRQPRIAMSAVTSTSAPAMQTQTTRATCPYCGTGCGVLIESRQGRIIEVKGDPDHPANFGRL